MGFGSTDLLVSRLFGAHRGGKRCAHALVKYQPQQLVWRAADMTLAFCLCDLSECPKLHLLVVRTGLACLVQEVKKWNMLQRKQNPGMDERIRKPSGWSPRNSDRENQPRVSVQKLRIAPPREFTQVRVRTLPVQKKGCLVFIFGGQVQLSTKG